MNTLSMEVVKLKPRKALNKAFLKVKPNRREIEGFKEHLVELLDRSNARESEEFHKNLIIDFLKKTYYDPEHFINTKGRNDLVIHNGSKAKSPVGVILEAKKPTNRAEMLRPVAAEDPPDQQLAKINVKAMQELVLYYLRERISQKNLEIKHLIITNIHEWFIFDATTFDRLFAQNKKLVEQFRAFEGGRLADTRTEFFYKEIARTYIAEIRGEIPYTYFDIRDYERPLRNTDKADDRQLIALYKLLSPEHLLKLPFVNDSNSLDKRFYSELLHIIGLRETKKGSKKLIERNAAGERHTGTLLEDAIIQLDSLDKLRRLERPGQYGSSTEEKLFNVALELSLTWINRILFLKLLEAQLLSYHKGDPDYAFLNFRKIRSYDDLNSLFFQVLAKRQDERNADVIDAFARVPYLNSSLFQPTRLEQDGLFISNLRDDKKIPIVGHTVLKDEQGRKRTGELTTLEYLFEFLDAYDFSSEGSEEIQEENKALINASVLGLIFEKINGYKDGSFFTPGFITMYMCRETIRKAVVQKFNEVEGWECENMEDLYDRIEDRGAANEIVNSLKICDPAVGSGHFLVSALNEMIAVKNDLRILQDREGKRLKEYQVEVVNDELIVTDEEGELFDYKPNSRESQRVQEALFHEKQTLIENCLFGVDINPNSVKICRLRLWIELLKNAYYKNERELETLPNIDINIKCGNSLVSRFDIDADIKRALKKSKWTIDSYRVAVATYRNAESKEQKRKMKELIADIKSDFRSEISRNDPKVRKLKKLQGDLFQLTHQGQLFEMKKREKAAWEKKVKKLTQQVEKLEAEIEAIRANKIYEHAFEWRFEFPEVLNEEGDFVGFDVVIGNPPYIRQEEISDLKPYLKNNFDTFSGTADLFTYFVELGFNVLKDSGDFCFIIPNKWMRAGYGKNLRRYLKSKQLHRIIDFGDLPVFEEASTYPIIIQIRNETSVETFKGLTADTLDFDNGLPQYVSKNEIEVLVKGLQDDNWSLTPMEVQELLLKIKSTGTPLREYVDKKIFRGILTGLNKAFIIDEETKERLIASDPKSADIIKPFLSGRDIKRYNHPVAEKFLIFTRRGIEIDEYPSIYNHLKKYRTNLEPKPKDFSGENWQGRKTGSYKWYEIQDAVDYHLEFEKAKIAWPETSKDNQFSMISEGVYLNKTSFMIPTLDYFLLGLLNSTLAKFYFNSIVSKMRGGYFSMSKTYVETIPIIKPEKLAISKSVKDILSLKKQDPSADTSALEAEVDRMVYELYGLTEEEVRIVEGV